VLSAHTVLDRDGVTVADVACRHEPGRGGAEEHHGRHAVVFVRRGCFVRRAEGVEAVLDPTVAYCANPGQEQRYDHPHARGDDCTAVHLEAGLVAALWGGEPALPPGPLHTSPEIDLEHRMLLSAARRADDPHELVERAVGLTAGALAQVDPRRVEAGRPATAQARRALADGAREALAAAPDRSLPELARALAVSPHHLSRVFRAVTGRTVWGIACACGRGPRSSALPAASATSHAWRPTSASPTRATCAASCAGRPGAPRPPCGTRSPSGPYFAA
jgi:hypothetical protein